MSDCVRFESHRPNIVHGGLTLIRPEQSLMLLIVPIVSGYDVKLVDASFPSSSSDEFMKCVRSYRKVIEGRVRAVSRAH